MNNQLNTIKPVTKISFSRHRLRLVGRTDGGLHPAFYSSPNGDIVEHRICEITRDSGYPPPATSQILRPIPDTLLPDTLLSLKIGETVMIPVRTIKSSSVRVALSRYRKAAKVLFV